MQNEATNALKVYTKALLYIMIRRHQNSKHGSKLILNLPTISHKQIDGCFPSEYRAAYDTVISTTTIITTSSDSNSSSRNQTTPVRVF